MRNVAMTRPSRSATTMRGDLVVVVCFELLRDMLLNDEYLTSQGVHRRHQRIGNLDGHNRRQLHGLLRSFRFGRLSRRRCSLRDRTPPLTSAPSAKFANDRHFSLGLAHQSGFETADRTIGSQRAFSSFTKLANVAGSIRSASMPSCSNRVRTCGKSRAANTAWFKRSTTLSGRPTGPDSENQVVATRSG